MKKRLIFVTGTDTGVGKTYASVQLLRYFNRKSFRTLALKPIASGCRFQEGKLVNDDALELAQAASVLLPYDYVNPFAFLDPIAPIIAAKKVRLTLAVSRLNQATSYAFFQSFDVCLIEGVGGWLQPLNEKETLANYVLHHNMEIILVVGMRLGCLNHALLSAQEILHSGGNLIGWIANSLEEKINYFEENVEILRHWLPIPHLGTIMPYADLMLFNETSPDEKDSIL